MPYEFGNPNTATALALSDFWNLAEFSKTLRRLVAVEYRYVESRNSGHAALTRLLEGATLGGNIFNSDKQFPNTLADGYVSNYNPDFSRTIAALANSLSWGGSTSVPKDIQQRGDGTPVEIQIVNETAVQDNTKRYESLVAQLYQHAFSTDHILTRQSFESLTGAVWTNPS